MAIIPLTLINPGAEAGNTTGWTSREGGVPGVGSTAHTGLFGFISTPSGATARWDQQIAIDPVYYSLVDSGSSRVKASAWHSGFSGDGDSGALYLEAVASDGVTILSRVENLQSDPSAWTLEVVTLWLPSGTRFLRIGTNNIRKSGTELSSYWDDFGLELYDDPDGGGGNTLRTNTTFLQEVFYPLESSKLRTLTNIFQYSHYPLIKPFLRANVTQVQYSYYPEVKPFLRTTAEMIQYIVRAPEETMSTEIFPGSAGAGGGSPDPGRPMLRGMTYNNISRPGFSTKVAEHTSGKETATAYWENPKWEFELSFDWLPNQPGINEDYKTLCGFFLSRRGRYDTFLYRNPDDYLVEDLVVGTGNGILTEWELYRPMGSFNEPVGQVDTAELDVWLDGPKDYVVGTGPYTFDLHSGTVSISSVKAGATVLADVSPAMPANGNEYNKTGNTLTFHSSRSGQTVTVTQKLLATPTIDYTVLMPRTLVFTFAPATGVSILSTFQFFFACRFLEDSQEFEQFAHRLWDLKEMTIRSIIQ